MKLKRDLGSAQVIANDAEILAIACYAHEKICLIRCSAATNQSIMNIIQNNQRKPVWQSLAMKTF
ncbi:hypothetical protein MYX84_02580 [Acidobacteria bacterium AH-259-O06]|nr:hypothetical protein [Acidobacteria bacterium AH-259-O06]